MEWVIAALVGLGVLAASGGAVAAAKKRKRRIGVRNGQLVVEGPKPTTTPSSGTTSSGASPMAPETPVVNYDFGRFSLTRDVLHSNTAEQRGISNAATPEQLRAAEAAAQAFLIPMDIATGGRVRVTSWFRNEEVNAAVGGANGSQHTRGEAIDFYIEGMDRNDAYNLLRQLVADGRAHVDQAILYHRDTTGPNIHASYTTRRANRRKYTFRTAGGSYVNYTGQVA